MSFTPIESFQEVRQQWESLLSVCSANTLYLTPQWQEVWWDTYGRDREMAGFYIEDPEGSEGVMAIASLSRQNGVASLLGSPETFDYNDFMIRPGYEARFFPQLLERLDSQGLRRLELYSLRESSPTLQFLPDLARDNGYLVEVSEEDVAPGLDLPGSWDEYLALLSKKDRHELRRKFRRLEGLENWRSYTVTDEGEVTERLGDFLRLMRMSDPEKSEYMTPEREGFFRDMARRTAELGLIKLFFLELEGRLVAASLCFDYDSTRLLYNSGHDPEHRYYSVGLLLNALCLRDAIEQGKTYFDFLRGSEPYKYHLGGRNQILYQMVVSKS
jgi:CelD/BcsL family acetyltransferase involved in cellulose biosynthesis